MERFKFKQQFTLRFTEAEAEFNSDLANELIPDITEDTPSRTVINALIQRAARTIPAPAAPSQAEAEKIQLLENEIGRLKIDKDFLKDANERLENEIRDHAPAALGVNQEVITYPPIIARILDIEAGAAKRKTGKTFNNADLLLGLYWEAVKIGRAYPYKEWDRSELAGIANELKQTAHVDE